MLGAIIGDIAGSRFEWHNIKTKDFDLLMRDCRFTDDSVMSLAICEALLNSKVDYSDLAEQTVKYMQKFGRAYPHAGYGRSFKGWILANSPKPYNSWGNGAAMRVSGCGFAASTLEQAKELSRKVTAVTHNHPEGLKGAEVVSAAVFLAKTGKNIPCKYDHHHSK